MTCSTLYTALITPFHDEALDIKGVQTLIQRQVDASIPGLLILGSTAEALSLTSQEKMEIYHTARAQWTRKTLMVGCGAYPTQKALEEISLYTDADLLLVASPSYYRPTQEGLYKHFMTLADKTSVPIILYNHPARTGVNLDPKVTIKLAKHPQIIGIKEVNFANFPTLTVHFRQDPNFSIFTGNDADAYAGALMGTSGTISVLSNLLPWDMLSLMEAAFEKDYQAADMLYKELSPLIEMLDCTTNPIPLKAAMQHFDLPSGSPRLPLLSLESSLRKRLQTLLDQCFANTLSAF